MSRLSLECGIIGLVLVVVVCRLLLARAVVAGVSAVTGGRLSVRACATGGQ